MPKGQPLGGRITKTATFMLLPPLLGRAGYFVGRYGIDLRLRDGIRNTDGAPKNFLGKNPAFQFYGNELYANVPKIKEYFEVTNVATGMGYVNSEFVLFSAEEVLFNMAEPT